MATVYCGQEGEDLRPNVSTGGKLNELIELYPQLDPEKPWTVIDLDIPKTYMSRELDIFTITEHRYVVIGAADLSVPTVNMDSFKALLARAKISRPQEKVLSRVLRYCASEAIFAVSPRQAAAIYYRMKSMPGTTTKQSTPGFLFDVPLSSGGRCVLERAFRVPSMTPVVCKLAEDASALQREHQAWLDIVGSPRDPSFPIVYSMELLPLGDSRMCLVLPRYANDLGSIEAQLPSDAVEKIVTRVRLGLQMIHAAGCVHSDIKPSNLLIAFDGQIAIGDLGSVVRIGAPRFEYTDLFLHPRAVTGRACAADDMWALLASALYLRKIWAGDRQLSLAEAEDAAAKSPMLAELLKEVQKEYM